MSADKTSTLTDAMQTYYDNKFLKKVKEKVLMDQVAQKRPYKKNMGKTVDFYRYRQVDVVQEPLTEGDNGTEGNITDQNVTCQLYEWGDWYKPSRFFALTTRDRGLEGYTEVAADQMAESYDMVAMRVQCTEGGYPILADTTAARTVTGTPDTSASNSTTVMYDAARTEANDFFNGGRICITAKDGTNYAFTRPCSDFVASTDLLTISGTANFSGGTATPRAMEAAFDTTDDYVMVSTANTSATDIISSSNIRLALRALQDNKAMPLRGRYYVGIIDPYVAYDLMADSQWIAVQTYKDQTDGIFKGEIGQLWGVRWVMTTQPWRQAVTSYQYSATGAVHVVPVMGREALGCVDLVGQGKHMIVKQPGPSDTSNPLNMFQTVGWKFTGNSVTLNALFSVNIFCGATA